VRAPTVTYLRLIGLRLRWLEQWRYRGVDA
jgi:hypothetical protein